MMIHTTNFGVLSLNVFSSDVLKFPQNSFMDGEKKQKFFKKKAERFFSIIFFSFFFTYFPRNSFFFDCLQDVKNFIINCL